MFSIDKDQSLMIIKNVLGHLTEEGQVSYNYDCNHLDLYGKEAKIPDIVGHRHRLAIVELELENCGESDDVDDCLEAFHQAIKNGNWTRSTKIEIYFGSQIHNDEIHLKAYLHETSAECDVSYPCFTYDGKYHCWIIKDTFWSATKGIDCNGIVTILDFTDYKNL